MYLQNLKLTNFKNYSAEGLVFSRDVNCFLGANGMGKTNLLDAIYYLCVGKSKFAVRDKNVAGPDGDFFRLEGDFSKEDKAYKIVCKIQPSKSKLIEKNQVLYSKNTEHVGFFSVVMIAPDDQIIALGGSEDRRRFMDQVLCQIDEHYLGNLILYNRVLSQRNKALKSMFESRRFDEALIETFDFQMATPAQYIFEKRKEWLEDFLPYFDAVYSNLSTEEQPFIKYKSHLAEASLLELLAENREKDRVLQRTTKGIHKDDLHFELKDFPLKNYASQGQLKSFILSLKIGQYKLMESRSGQAPILLLDDVFDKLDHYRTEALFSMIGNKDFGQVFITDTGHTQIEEVLTNTGRPFELFQIENGTAKN